MTTNVDPNLQPGAVLSSEQWNAITTGIRGLNNQQLLWVSGYLAGLAQQGEVLPAATASAGEAASLTILYGSQTGNAKGVASQYKEVAEQAGFAVKLVSMADYKPRSLKKESHLLIAVSTHGEGEAPDDAVELHEFLASKKAPKLSDLKYAVIALGDSSYEFFCQTGKDFDVRLAALGATALLPRLDCDVDYEQDVASWSEKLTDILAKDLQAAATAAPVQSVQAVSSASQTYNKKKPFEATLIESQKITGRDSVKDTRHVEISLEGSGIRYLPGDALGVYFTNPVSLVEELLGYVSLSGDETVSLQDESMTLRGALIDRLELTQSYPKFVLKYAEFTQQQALLDLSQDKAVMRDYLTHRQIVDIVKTYPAPLQAQQLVDALRTITPRLYSIASSQAEVEEEVHLTVGLVADDVDGVTREGGASSFLCKRVEPDQNVKVFIEANNNFRLPESGDTPVIMIGPGTGIAPFRAFLQQRQADEAEGKNWLFFGNPSFTQDFLYQTEIQGYVKDGLLSKVSLAFSRDQAEKIYVQHRILQHGKEVWQWLQDGAHVYICGDATRMAKDVEQALLNVISEHGQLTQDQAQEFLTELRKAKRYQKDVY